MSTTDDTRRYKWTKTSTNLLVSIWSHEMVQARLKLSSRNQPVWDSIGRFMRRKGFKVSGLQCRTRIKNMMCNYHEAIRKKDRSLIEPYFNTFQKVVNSRGEKPRGALIRFKDITFFDITGKREGVVSQSNAEKTIENAQDAEPVAQKLDQSTAVAQESTTTTATQVTQESTTTTTTPVTDTRISADEENSIVKAINNQTRVILDAIKVQTETFEKLFASEKEKLEVLILAEKKSREELEVKMDNIIKKLESHPAVKQFSKSPIIS